MQSHLDDAVAKGAKLTIVVADKTPASKDNRRMPLHILQNVTEDMQIMLVKILGHILPIMTYADVTKVPVKIEPRRNPLAICCFGRDKSEQPYLLSDVQSDRSCSNDIRLHYAQEGLTFF